MTCLIPLPGRRRSAGVGSIGYGLLAALCASTLLQWALMPYLPYVLTGATAAAIVFGYLLGERHRRDRIDKATELPNVLALYRAVAAQPDANIVVVQIDHFAKHAVALGPSATGRMVARIAERLVFGSVGRAIFRLDEASLAWLEAPGDEDSLEDRLDALAALMRSPIDCGRPVDVTLAFGLATGPDDDIRERVEKASRAARHAARFGMRWKRSLDDSVEDMLWPASLPNELDGAIASGQLWVAYQPQLDIRTGRFGQVEAFARWLHPRCGPISPSNFVPLIEAHGRARDLAIHVLTQALESAQRWEDAGFPVGIAVNMSTPLLADHEFIEMVGMTLRSSRSPAHCVTIEVEEATAAACPARTIAALESWRSHGIDIALSGYGGGCSPVGLPLATLEKLPATRLKIDKTLVRSIAVDPRNAAAVRAVILLAHGLGMTAVAEGVEDAACLALLRAMGCDIAQGYHIARPMTGSALTEFLAERSRAVA